MQTTAVSSAIAALAVLSTKKAKAEEAANSTTQPLGELFSDDINSVIQDWEVPVKAQLIPTVAKNGFEMTFPVPVADSLDANIYTASFQIQDDDVSNNGVIIQQTGVITLVPKASDPLSTEESYLKVDRGDGEMVSTIDIGGLAIIADGTEKWHYSKCGFFKSFHPSYNKNELKIVGGIPSSSVYRVPLDSKDYCEQKIKDSKENGPFEVLGAPETKELLATQRYIKATDTLPSYLLTRKPDGTLLHLQRSSDGTWTKKKIHKRHE